MFVVAPTLLGTRISLLATKSVVEVVGIVIFPLRVRFPLIKKT